LFYISQLLYYNMQVKGVMTKRYSILDWKCSL